MHRISQEWPLWLPLPNDPGQWFSNFSDISTIWRACCNTDVESHPRASDSVSLRPTCFLFLTNSQMMSVLLVQQPHFENHSTRMVFDVSPPPNFSPFWKTGSGLICRLLMRQAQSDFLLRQFPSWGQNLALHEREPPTPLHRCIRVGVRRTGDTGSENTFQEGRGSD